jgi:hypothetical protein
VRVIIMVLASAAIARAAPAASARDPDGDQQLFHLGAREASRRGGNAQGLPKTFSDLLAQLLYDAASARRSGAESLPLGGRSTSFFTLVVE